MFLLSFLPSFLPLLSSVTRNGCWLFSSWSAFLNLEIQNKIQDLSVRYPFSSSLYLQKTNPRCGALEPTSSYYRNGTSVQLTEYYDDSVERKSCRIISLKAHGTEPPRWFGQQRTERVTAGSTLFFSDDSTGSKKQIPKGNAAVVFHFRERRW
jgi:hypothetical protein